MNKMILYLKYLFRVFDSDNTNAGFTLIEVAVSITILALGMVTLTGTTTRLMESTHQELQRSRASIFASYLIETSLTDSNTPGGTQVPPSSTTGIQSGQPQIRNESGQLIDKLRQLGYLDELTIEDFPYLDPQWTFQIINQPLELALLPSPPQHIIISVSWGPADHQIYTLETIRPPANVPPLMSSAGSPNPQAPNPSGP